MYQRRRAACPGAPTRCTYCVRAPASGVPDVPRAAAPPGLYESALAETPIVIVAESGGCASDIYNFVIKKEPLDPKYGDVNDRKSGAYQITEVERLHREVTTPNLNPNPKPNATPKPETRARTRSRTRT